ncbi:hypothetical protein VSS37_11775 [Candidatus Thiothrix sp. Deng01]|uniref:Aspartoacylase n=1 Tax=Candidatus Thiothrix phosphatis TaxID=3112415 RepID=A0ABU6CXV7_9GAMM|nr:hypothetical protein [Candidatus Thiothrix sp. Deng01]MEB4591661.1 hypothetical protein [Candidatus Thiothrix sp. Deng01]
MQAKALLVVGIHREERAFGEAVASGLDRALFDVLVIPDGLSGIRPRPDQRFHFDTLHRALYRQLLPYVSGHYPLLVDLHTGVNEQAFCIDLFCREPASLNGLLAQWQQQAPQVPLRAVRMLQPGEQASASTPVAETVIPAKLWRNPAFRYLGVEAFLTTPGDGSRSEQQFTRMLLEQLSAAQ